MTSSNDSHKIVDLKPRAAGFAAPFAAALSTLRALATRRLAAQLAQALDRADDHLFGLSERADNGTAQAQFFDAMRDLRKKRAGLERLHSEGLARIFADFNSGRLRAAVVEPGAHVAPSDELSLLDDHELDESLAVSGMVAKAESRVSRGLFALNQRLTLATGRAIETPINPLAPAQLASVFRALLPNLDAGIEIKLIVLKLYDRFVMGSLDGLYDEINTVLVQAGVLPTLRAAQPAGRAPVASPGPTASKPTQTLDAHLGTTESASAAAASPVELHHAIWNLLAERRAPGTHTAAYSSVPQHPVAGGQSAGSALLDALHSLQSTAAQEHLRHSADHSHPPVAALKQVLQNRIRPPHGTTTGAALPRNEEDVIDLVAMLFEFIVSDRNLPPPMQALLSRLQIPYIKVALLDRRAFLLRSHPARQLLDAMAQAGAGWSAEADQDQRLYGEVQRIVAALLNDFQTDFAVFSRLLAEFNAFTAAQRRRAELAEQRVTDAARGREKLLAARQAVGEMLQQYGGTAKLPLVVRQFIDGPWSQYLVLMHLRHNGSGPQWLLALRAVDELLWMARTDPDADDPALNQRWENLARTLRQGLASVAGHESDAELLLAELRGTTQRKALPILAAEPPVVVAPVARAEAVPESIEALSQDFSADAFEFVAGEALAGDSKISDCVERVGNLPVGAWLEFRVGQNRAIRAKLSWISPISSRYLFVNCKGLKVADKTLGELAADLRDGRATLLDDEPLTERAFDAILGRLSDSKH